MKQTIYWTSSVTPAWDSLGISFLKDGVNLKSAVRLTKLFNNFYWFTEEIINLYLREATIKNKDNVKQSRLKFGKTLKDSRRKLRQYIQK